MVTRRARTNGKERVVVETYLPSIGGAPHLSQRVDSVTTVTSYGTQTVEETEQHDPVAPSEPLRVVRRTLTTVRTSGAESHVSERKVFERDLNGHFVLVRTEAEGASRN